MRTTNKLAHVLILAVGGRERDTLRVLLGEAGDGPRWVLAIGPGAPASKESIQRHAGLDAIAGKGIAVWAPDELGVDEPAAPLTALLANRLLKTARGQATHGVVVHLPAATTPAVLAACLEAAALYPDVTVRVGGADVGPNLTWSTRRDLFESPPPAGGGVLVGKSALMATVRAEVEQMAGRTFPVLVLGPTGSGKEVVARMLHERSARPGNFMPVNAAQLPVELADSLLFGHKKGAFTGADKDRPGRIVEARDGTFFLDEVFDLAPPVQGKLLRAFNNVERGIVDVEPVGATQATPVHVRLVCAAQEDPLLAAADAHRHPIRKDLYFRVAVGVIRLPPLSARREDIPLLADHLLATAGIAARPDKGALALLAAQDWPGNLRELRLVLVRASLAAGREAEVLGEEHVRASLLPLMPAPGAPARFPTRGDLDREMARAFLATADAALLETGNNAAEAERRLGLTPKSLARRRADALRDLTRPAPETP